MEAFAELAELTRDADVIRSLAEALQINQQRFYPRNPNDAVGIRHPDWRPVPGQADAELAYGHNFEFAWLTLRAEKVLGHGPRWATSRPTSGTPGITVQMPSWAACFIAGRGAARRPSPTKSGGFKRNGSLH
ncbi:MAG: hypothetical protein NZ739_07965 [Verrucomicrobiae bacterium]|nr:hypothetical protein [Verrucomicrobiae bacterium]